MEELKMVLGDGSGIEIVGFALPLSVTVNCESMAEMAEIWERLHMGTSMSKIEILRDSVVCGTYFDVKIDGVQVIKNGDDTLTAHFYMRDSGSSQTEMENEYAQAARILLGEEE